eukprot:3241194-Pyramimonas_sp.AAC.1
MELSAAGRPLEGPEARRRSPPGSAAPLGAPWKGPEHGAASGQRYPARPRVIRAMFTMRLHACEH